MMGTEPMDWLPEISEEQALLARLAEQCPGMWWQAASPVAPGWRATMNGVGQTPRCMMLRIVIRAGSDIVTASIPPRFAELFLNSPVHLLSPASLAIAADIVLGPALDALSADKGDRCWIVQCELGLPPVGEMGLLIALEWGNGSLGLSGLSGDPDLLSRIIRRIPQSQAVPQSPHDNLNVSALVHVGWTLLTAGEAASLQIGDAVIMDGEALALEVEGFGAWPVSIEQGFAQVLRRPVMFQRRTPMPNPDQELTIDQIPVELSFVLYRPALTLATARSLVPGSVIPLGPHDPIRVEVLANGARIGSGRLTRLGDQAAVEITSLASNKA